MKIVSIMASPRSKGNSEAIADKFLETAKSLGAEIQVFHLRKRKYQGCIACMGCKTKHEQCVLVDDLTEILDAVRTTDILIMATPVYYGDIPSQLKAFVDRTFCYLLPDFHTNPNPSRLPGEKKLLMILTQGHPSKDQFKDIFPRYESFFQWYGFKDNHVIRGTGLGEKGEALKRKDILKEAEELAKKLAS